MYKSVFVLIVTSMLYGCNEISSNTGEQEPIFFQAKMFNDPQGNEDFIVVTDDPEIIALARSQLSLPVGERTFHINGALARGNGGFNYDWNWHFIESGWNLTEVSIELCDGGPDMIELALDYFIDNLGGACPWGSYIAEEITEPLN